MNVVILHCHFERGGVTQVVENHVRWLRDCDGIDQIVLVSGDRTSGQAEQTRAAVNLVSLPEFDYDTRPFGPDSIPSRATQISDRLTEQLNGIGVTSANTVLHWHNHSLGKNTAAPEVIRLLARAGWRLLLQIHDFAEDNRTGNYQNLIDASGAADKSDIDRYLYPVADQIHYASLTEFDASVLAEIGIPASQTHALPNSVVAPSAKAPDREQALKKVRHAMKLPKEATWCLYPVRGIRRKNVGEFLLLSRWTPPGCHAGLTLCPATPVEKRSYQRWKELVPELAPRSVFDAAHHPDISFADNLAASQFILSTSVAEGFGMAFLEPWLSRREVIARRLVSVIRDFEESGVKLPKLYNAVPIPGTDSWQEACRAEIEAAFRAAWSRIPEPLQPAARTAADHPEGGVDFARLTPRRQIEVLRRVAGDPGFESDVQDQSRELVASLRQDADEALIDHNADIISRHYSLESTGRKLTAAYDALAASAADSQCRAPSRAGTAVDLINAERPFFPCRMEILDA